MPCWSLSLLLLFLGGQAQAIALANQWPLFTGGLNMEKLNGLNNLGTKGCGMFSGKMIFNERQLFDFVVGVFLFLFRCWL